MDSLIKEHLAKELLIIIGDYKTINYMIQNVDSKKRNTGLKSKLEQTQD